MTAEIISVGTELLLGDILNTNAQYLSRALAALGINVYYETTVGDNQERLTSAIALARSRCDLLVFSGGLGPTDDDITKEAVAAAFGDSLVYSAEVQDKIERFFASSGRSCPVNNTKQAMIPVKGISLDNANGTAPGAIFTDEHKYAVVLPGPPCECIPMYEQAVMPYLAQLTGGTFVSLTLREVGIGESHLQDKLQAYLAGANPTVALYAKTGEVLIRITASAADKQAATAMCEATAKLIAAELGDCFYAYGDNGLEYTVVELLRRNKLTLATAESCTGGLLSACITSVPGSSAVFSYGACTYSEAIKAKVLGVSPLTIAQYGVVSREVAAEMAIGVRRAASCDIGVGITGIAGPDGGTQHKPVGLVYIAVCDKCNTYTYKMLYINRSRDTIRQNAVMCALDMLRRISAKCDMRGCDKYNV